MTSDMAFKEVLWENYKPNSELFTFSWLTFFFFLQTFLGCYFDYPGMHTQAGMQDSTV